MGRALANTEATVRSQMMIYKAVSQSVLLYGSDIWAVTSKMLNFLEWFHHRAARLITGMTETHGTGREWEYPPVVTSMEAAGLHLISQYIRRLQATIAEKVACSPISELCADAERILGKIWMVRWDEDVANEPKE